MKEVLFLKAKRNLKFLIREGTTEYNEYWMFKYANLEVPMEIVDSVRGSYIKCGCKVCVTKNVDHPEILCPHKIALILKKGGKID